MHNNSSETIVDGLALYCAPVGWIPSHVVHYLGHPFVYPTASEVGRAIARGWKWDNVLGEILTKLVPEEQPSICEVGSNIGASLMMMLSVKPRAQVLCFEPSDRFRVFLNYNLTMAGYAGVRASTFIVSSTCGEGYIHTDLTSGSIREMPHLKIRQPAHITTLNHELSGLDTLSMIKTDTDGHDMEVLFGADLILLKHKPILFFEFCPGLMKIAPVDALERLGHFGYQQFICLDHLGFLVGITRDAGEAVKWSQTNVYCDILTCAEGSRAEQYLPSLCLPPKPPISAPA